MDMLHEIHLQTEQQDEMVEITAQIENILLREKVQNGLVTVYCPHTTAGITINENADPDVRKDFLRRLDEVYPWKRAKDQHSEGNSAAHLKASAVGASQTVIVRNGKLLLGRWQGIYFCEFDGPRPRSYYVKIYA
ncbi:hypothetical protein CEB3_c29290 [Peptococcaceae bacterium CEB3]|nr:hypothetical protein CEB3_c29290 [Peptococcaceae bacterium CEB3]